MVIIISGYVCSLATYLEVGFVSIGVEAEEAENVSVAHTFLYVGSALFIYGNFCLTIERWLASCIVSTYEKYSSSQLSLALTCLIVAVPPCILGIVISQVWTDQLISFLSFFAFSLVSGVISTYLRCNRSSRVGDSSLGSRCHPIESLSSTWCRSTTGTR